MRFRRRRPFNLEAVARVGSTRRRYWHLRGRRRRAIVLSDAEYRAVSKGAAERKRGALVSRASLFRPLTPAALGKGRLERGRIKPDVPKPYP